MGGGHVDAGPITSVEIKETYFVGEQSVWVHNCPDVPKPQFANKDDFNHDRYHGGGKGMTTEERDHFTKTKLTEIADERGWQKMGILEKKIGKGDTFKVQDGTYRKSDGRLDG